MSLKKFTSILKKTWKGWVEDDPFRQSAVVAYYAVFSLPALLVIIISSISLFFDRETIMENIRSGIGSTIGVDTAMQVEKMITAASETKDSLIATIIGILTILIGATGVFGELQKSLNIIWDVKMKPNQSFFKIIKDRIFSFGLILSIGFLLLISMVVTSLITALSTWLQSFFPDYIVYVFYVVNFIISFATISILFALMYKILPDAKISWKDTWFGTFLTTALFIIGKFLLGLYFGTAEPGSIYGTAGSIVLILLWVSYSSMIVCFGAEFTKQNALANGRHIVPTENAEERKNGEHIET